MLVRLNFMDATESPPLPQGASSVFLGLQKGQDLDDVPAAVHDVSSHTPGQAGVAVNIHKNLEVHQVRQLCGNI